MKKDTRSVKYSLTYSGHKVQKAKDSEKPIIYHIVRDGFGANCGAWAHHRLDRKPTGKRYQLCLRCKA